MKTIGIVCEGPRDFDMLSQVIMRFMNEEYLFLPIQPDQDISSPHGAGWKGVLRWCTEYKDSLPEYFSGIDPQIDLLVIQIDGDVPRREHEIYCNSVNIGCSGQPYEDPLNCSIAKKDGCNQVLPPNAVCDGSVQARVCFMESTINDALGRTDGVPIVITIPCDSMDTWIIAACDASKPNPEEIISPWESTISLRKDYFGVRISGHKKHRKPYSDLIAKVCEKWDDVKQRCPQSSRFESLARTILDH